MIASIEQSVFHIHAEDGKAILDEIVLPTGFEELAQPSFEVGWTPTVKITKPDGCSLPGEIMIFANFSEKSPVQFNLLLHICTTEKTIKILAISAISLSDDVPTPLYWFGAERYGVLVDGDTFNAKFQEYLKVYDRV